MNFHLIFNKGRETAIQYTFIILILTLRLGIGSSTYSTSLSQCVTNSNSGSYKWCKFHSTTSYGYICPYYESSTYWNYYNDMRWSTDSSYLPQNSKYLLCPTYSSYWSTQSYSLSYVGDYRTLSSYSFGTSYVCWYRFDVTSSYIKNVTITIDSLSSASAEVYYESSSYSSSFSYLGSLLSGSSINVSTSYYSSVLVLIIPSSSSSYGTVYAKAFGTTSSSSSSSSSTITKIPLLTLFIILILFTGGFLIVWLITWLCLCIWTWAKGNKHPVPTPNYNNLPVQEQQFYRQ